MTTNPETPERDEMAQSLASGAAGAALLDVEHALTGSGTWQAAHHRITRATAAPLSNADHAGLYYGAPAISFVLHAARSDGRARYDTTLTTLDQHVLRLVHRRVTTAEQRMACGQLPTFGEFDLFYGLTGLGALLLRHLPGNDALGRVLTYLVRLTQPRDTPEGTALPGWWVNGDPDPILPTPGGHANLGMAHGAAGILALLSLASTRGVEVDGQRETIERLCALFDRWRQDNPNGPWWPQWLTRDDLRRGRPTRTRPGRPSWCYGALGIARAHQLAALATDDHRRRLDAERALAANLSDTHLSHITEPGLCHGLAGVYQTAWRAHHDALTPAIAERLPTVADALDNRATAGPDGNTGLLTGAAGVGLALQTARHAAPPRSGWDACLLIT